VLLSLTSLAAQAQETPGCNEWQAVFVLVDGNVTIRNGSTFAWAPAVQGSVVCMGYSVRVDAFGHAALQLPDQTLLHLSRNTTLTFDEPDEDVGSLVELVQGLIHIISRDPRALKFTTPYANAGLEGTEFLIAVEHERTRIDVIEGEVVVSNSAGEIAVPAGQRAVSGRGIAPQAAPLADAVAATRWMPFYPPILYLDLPDPDSTTTSTQRDDPDFLAARAARRLGVGAVADAEADLERALELASDHATAQALSALVSLGRGEKAGALRTASAAVASDPESVPALIALSHVQQAMFEFRAALASLALATDLEPGNALAWAWLAELRLSNGDTQGALAAAEHAVALDANVPHVQTVLGFVHLGRSTTERAVAAFEGAIRMDQQDPLPRVGLALSLMRRGELAAGREQAEIAVILAPSNSLVRSYMAKIYAEESRLGLTETQLHIAQLLDGADPTPLYYRALNRQAQNRSIEALHSLHSAFARNGDRPLFRSTLHVEEDLAVRSSGVGHVYKDLGFENLALLDGWKATLEHPEDYAAHRLLADLYPATPRQEIARVNELYRAQLLQPINVTPIPAQLAEANLFILKAMGPSDLGFSEYGPLTLREGLSFLGSAIAAGNNTAGTSISVAGLNERLSYSAGHFSFASDGFRPNNDLDQEVANALVHYRLGADSSFQAELRSASAERGDLRMLFDPAAYNALLRQDEQVESLRLGARHSLSPRSTLVATAILEDQESSLTSGPGFALHTTRSGTTIDIQHLQQWNRVHLTSGIRHLDQDAREASTIIIPIPGPPFQVSVENEASSGAINSSAYAYASVSLTDNATAIIGAAADRVETDFVQSSRISPKLGLLFEPSSTTTIRAAAFQTLEGPFVSRYSIQPRLEPTHVAGFNQYFFGSEGEETTRVGLAIDHEISARLFTGAEVTNRSVDVLVRRFLPDGSTTIEPVDRDERLFRSYVYWTPTSRISVAAEYQDERVDGNGDRLVDGFERLETRRVPVSLNLFNAKNLHTSIRATYIEQEGTFSPFESFPVPVIEPGSDAFWVVDLSLSYRLPKRRGAVSLSLDNAFDEEFRFQDTDPENQSIMPERMLAFRFTMSY